jgi:6-carboxyhexanoate--CoA ligase
MDLFNVRMRSSKRGEHVSGAERIVKPDELEEAVLKLLRRARNHPKGESDSISIKVEKLKEPPKYLKAIPVFEVKSSLPVKELLPKLSSGKIPEKLLKIWYELLLRGPAPDGQVMRGAALIEIKEGKRLEPDPYRGVRVTTLDGTEELRKELKKAAGRNYTENLFEALTVATKVLSHEKVLGELCVSDDPDYTTGYLTVKGVGYFRIKGIKPKGLKKGGRVFFVKDGKGLKELIEFLEKRPVIVTGPVSYSFLEL